jgi:hypothetical protein
VPEEALYWLKDFARILARHAFEMQQVLKKYRKKYQESSRLCRAKIEKSRQDSKTLDDLRKGFFSEDRLVVYGCILFKFPQAQLPRLQGERIHLRDI